MNLKTDDLASIEKILNIGYEKTLIEVDKNGDLKTRDEAKNKENIAFNKEAKLFYKKNEHIVFLSSGIKNSEGDTIEYQRKKNKAKEKAIIIKICECSSRLLVLIKINHDFLEQNSLEVVDGSNVILDSPHYLFYSPGGEDDPPQPRQPLSGCGNVGAIENIKDTIDNIEVYRYLENNLTVNRSGRPVVAVMDTGIDLYYWNNYQCPLLVRQGDSCGLSNNRIYGWNFVENNELPFDDNYSNKHGTRIAKIISNQANTQVQLMILKTFDYQGSASLFNIFCAFEYILNHNKDNIENPVNIINASWGYYGSPIELFKQYLLRINDANIWFINAAGNTTDFNIEQSRNIGFVSFAGGWQPERRYPACYSCEIDKVVTVTTIRQRLRSLRPEASNVGFFSGQVTYEPAENYSYEFVNVGVCAGFDGEFSDPIHHERNHCFFSTVKGSSYATAHFVGIMANRFVQVGTTKASLVSQLCEQVQTNNIGVNSNRMVRVEGFI